MKAVFVLIYVVIISTSLCANTLVIVVISASRQLRQSVTNVFFVSLALTDSLVAAVNMPFQLLSHLQNEWTLGQAACKLSTYLQGVVVVASILTLTGIAVDRSA